MNDQTKPPAPKLPEEIGVDYLCQRVDFYRDAGVPLTLELLTVHVTGAILITASAARDEVEEKDRLLLAVGDRLVGLVEIVAHLAHKRKQPVLSEVDYCPL